MIDINIATVAKCATIFISAITATAMNSYDSFIQDQEAFDKMLKTEPMVKVITLGDKKNKCISQDEIIIHSETNNIEICQSTQ